MNTKTVNTFKVYSHQTVANDTILVNGEKKTIGEKHDDGPNVWLYFNDGDVRCNLRYDVVTVIA